MPFCYSDICCVSDGSALNVSKADGLYVTDAVTGKTGYLSGEDLSVKIPVIYDKLWDFMDDRAAARLDGKAGVVRYDWTVEMPFSYDGISLFSDGSIALRTGETWELKDREGSVIFAGECGFISEQGEGYAISTDGKTSFYDRQGREVVSDRDGYDLNMNRNRVFGAENSYVLSSGILLKTGREDESDREEELLVNQITPRAGAFAELMKNGSITTDTTGPEHTTDAEMLRQCKRFGKLYRTEEEGELMLYFYAKPWVQPMFSESYSGFFVAKNGQAEQQITASECGGSMKGDRICFWYDAEKEALKPGTVGSYGGFGGMAYGGEIYRLGRGKAVLENSYMYSSEISADGEVKEMYFVNDKAVSEEAYLAVEGRYQWYMPIRITILFSVMLFCLTGCGRQDVPVTDAAETEEPRAEMEGETAENGTGEIAEDVRQVQSEDDAAAASSVCEISTEEDIDWAIWSEGIYCYSNGELCGYLDGEGERITECVYEEAMPFSEGLACVRLNGKYGYIGQDGETMLPFIYDQASSFREGVAYFSIGEEYGLIDPEGNVVLELTDCDSISSFREGLAYFSVDGRYGYMDKNGRIVVEPSVAMPVAYPTQRIWKICDSGRNAANCIKWEKRIPLCCFFMRSHGTLRISENPTADCIWRETAGRNN